MTSKARITVNDVAEAGLCVDGLTLWIQRNGFDVRQVVENGLSIDEVLGTGCAWGRLVVKKVRDLGKEQRLG